MQVFLPYANFRTTAQHLDMKRLGKQRVECMQIVSAVTGVKVQAYANGLEVVKAGPGWRNHPITKLWAPHLPYLVNYACEMCDEWVRRGYKDTTKNKIQLIGSHQSLSTPGRVTKPPFLGDQQFLDVYKKILILKDPHFYIPSFGVTNKVELRRLLELDVDYIYKYLPEANK